MRIPAPHATLVLAAGTAHTFAETTTMIELPKAQFGRLLPLFNPEPPHATMIYSALEGRTPARLHLTPATSPRSVSWSPTSSTSHLWAGRRTRTGWRRPSPRCAASTICINWPAREDKAWRRLPRRRFPLMRCRAGSKVLDCRPLPPHPHPGPPAAARQRRLVCARCLWHDEIVMAFGTAENFLRHGIGLCLTAGEETCSEAYAVWRGAGRFEIGIVTAEARSRVCVHGLPASHPAV